MSSTEEPIPVFLDTVVAFPDGRSYTLVRPLTNYRSCHDGTPSEARMVFSCRMSSPEPSNEEYVMKIKVQLPAEGATPEAGPSTTTTSELKALKLFQDTQASFAPQLVAFHSQAQDDRGPFPGGFITYTIMTKLPGEALFGKYWNMSAQERDVIVPKAAEALRAIYALGIEPIDRGLRNIIWEPETKQCGIIDFELWHETKETFANEKKEMQRWGLIRTPPAKDHWAAWNEMYR